MLVTMKETRLAAPDGVTVVTLEAGETYDLPDPFAQRYLDRNLATVPAPERATRASSRPRSRARARKAADSDDS